MFQRTLSLLVAASLFVVAASEAANAKRFVSKRYGYSLTLTTASTVYQPKQPWSGGTPFPDTVDTYSGPVAGRSLLAAARRLPAGRSLDDFTADADQETPGNCGRPESNVATRLGGKPARLFTHHCSRGWYLINVRRYTGAGATCSSRPPPRGTTAATGPLSTGSQPWRFAR